MCRRPSLADSLEKAYGNIMENCAQSPIVEQVSGLPKNAKAHVISSRALCWVVERQHGSTGCPGQVGSMCILQLTALTSSAVSKAVTVLALATHNNVRMMLCAGCAVR